VGEGVARVIEAVGDLAGWAGEAADGPRLVLENSAGGGFGLGATVEELALVLAAIDSHGVPRERIGLCLDTAHLWGAGYRIDESAGLDTLLAAVDEQIGLDRVAMVHLNDSRAEPGSFSDRHQHIGAGRIGEAGLRAVVCHPALAGAACYLETPGMDEGYDAINLARVRDLIEGRALAALPEKDLEMRGSRARTPPSGGED
jgi:deoxyribonuclease-4